MKPKLQSTRTARVCAMDYLARREHCYVELEKKLQLKQYDSDEIAQALQRLAQDGLLSDQRFCEQRIDYRVQQGYGPRWIQQELAQKGVEHAIIADGLALLSAQWRDIAKNAWLRRFGEQPNDAKAYQKQYRFLLNRGFEPEHIRDVLNHANHDIESD